MEVADRRWSEPSHVRICLPTLGSGTVQQTPFIANRKVKLMSITAVVFAVYGALPGGSGSWAEGKDVSGILWDLIRHDNGVVVCGNDQFGDPSSGNKKHFAAIITRGNQNFAFACEEGQTINFNEGGGMVSTPPQSITVKHAVYGALVDGFATFAQALDVTRILQETINHLGAEVVCGDAIFGDVASGYSKHFGAVVTRSGNSKPYFYACAEGQTINFAEGGSA